MCKLNVWFDKTTHFKMSLQAMGNCDGHLLISSKTMNLESNRQVNFLLNLKSKTSKEGVFVTAALREEREGDPIPS